MCVELYQRCLTLKSNLKKQFEFYVPDERKYLFHSYGFTES